MHQFNPEYQIQTKAPVNFLTGAFFLFKHTDKSLAYFGVKSCAGCLDIRGDRPSAANVLTLHTAKTGVQTLYHEYTLSTKFLVNHFCSESKRENCCGGSSFLPLLIDEMLLQTVGVESWGRGIPPTRGTSAADANIRAMRLIFSNITSTHYLTTFDTFCHSVTVVVVHWQKRMFVVEGLNGNAAGDGCLFSFFFDFLFLLKPFFFLLPFTFFASSKFKHFLTMEFFDFFLSTNRKLFIDE